MDEMTSGELAARAGVAPEEVDRLVAVGILTPRDGDRPYVPGDVRRIRLALACEQGGLPLDAIGEAVRAGRLSFAFLDLPSYSRWAGRAERTYEQQAAGAGLPLEMVLSLHEASGFPRPDPQDTMREDDDALLTVVQAAMAAGIEESVILRVVRVYAESLRRMAQAEAHVYHSNIEMPMLRSGMEQREIMQRASEFGDVMVPLMDAAVLASYHRQQERAWLEDLVEHIETTLEEADLYRRPPRPPAMCFLDLTGYTRLTEERGDHAAAELAANLGGLVQGVSEGHQGRPVKWLGDGVMFHFREAAPAVQASLEMVEGTPQAGLPPAHVGLDAGPVIAQDGDYFGRTVNTAARIADHAGPGEVLVSERVVEAAGDAGRFQLVGPVELKGLSRPVVLHRAMGG